MSYKTGRWDDFCGPTYLASSPVLDAERCINLYPEPGSRSSKSKMALFGTPGLNTFMTLAASPVRGLWAGNNRLFACGGNHVYEVSNLGAVITDYGVIPNSTGTGNPTPVVFQHDGTHLLLLDPTCPGSGGGLTGNVFNINPVGPAIQQVGNNGGGNVIGGALSYLDGFCVALDVATNNRFNVSALADGTTWNSANTVLRTGSTDLTTWLEVLNGQLFIFGQKNIEVWYNAGAPLFPFARIAGATINLGLLSPYTVQRFYNTIMFVGADDRGYAQVYMMQGTNPVRVSNWAVEQMLSQRAITLGNPMQIRAFGYQEAGHTFYVLRLGDATVATPFACIVYDLTTGLWHERSSIIGGVTGCSYRPNCFASAPFFSGSSSGFNFVGDFNTGVISYMTLGATSEGGNNIVRTRTTPHLSDRNKWISYPFLEIDADIGTAQMALSWSDDGGRSFPGAKAYAAKGASNDLSVDGFGRFAWQQLGRSRDRVFQATITDSANAIRLIDAYVGQDAGSEK